MKKLYTEGNWKVVTHPCVRIKSTDARDDRTLADVGPGWAEDNDLERRGNAQRMAKAPEMLAALKQVIKAIGDSNALHSVPPRLWNDICDLIQEVEG